MSTILLSIIDRKYQHGTDIDISPVPFADTNLIRFNGSRINGLSLKALRQVKRVYKISWIKPSRPVDNLLKP
jgi:hypothetical protein